MQFGTTAGSGFRRTDCQELEFQIPNNTVMQGDAHAYNKQNDRMTHPNNLNIFNIIIK